MLVGFFVPGGHAAAGWTSYAPLAANPVYTGVNMGQNLWCISLIVLGLSSLMGSINYITTVINMRAPGMTFFRMPLVIWALFITAILLLLALPVLTSALAMLLFDRTLGTSFFLPAGGGEPLLWQHLFWFFGHPEVYILILPAMGIVSEVIPVFSGKPLFSYSAVVFSVIAIGFLSFTVWAHHMFATGMPPVALLFFAADTFLISAPTGVLFFAWLGTLWRGKLRFTAPMLFSLGFMALFLIGGLDGIHLAVVPVDWQLTDTYYVVSHIHYVLFGGAIFGLFSGVYYWMPKMTGHRLLEGLGKWHFWLMFIGMNMVFMPMHILGLEGMPRRIYTYGTGRGWEVWNFVETIGAFIVAVSMLVFIVNFIVSMRRAATNEADPWDGYTLEWKTDSPPPVYNFAKIPSVRSRRPLWDEKHPNLADWRAEEG